MKKYIEKSLHKAIDYKNYKIRLNIALESEKRRENPDLALMEYLKLNKSRMSRIDKQFVLQQFCRETYDSKPNGKFTWLVIAEPWCGDAAQVLPVLHKMSNNCAQVDLKIALRDENPELMSQFLTRGKKSIPKLIALDKNLNVIFTWGPRPKEAQKIVEDDIRIHKKLSREGQIKLQKWYNQDNGAAIETELFELINVTLQNAKHTKKV